MQIIVPVKEMGVVLVLSREVAAAMVQSKEWKKGNDENKNEEW